jgi:hypothetical protein
MTFNTAGEKRKFFRNMRENVSARQIGVAGLGFMSLLGPLALVLFAVVAIWGAMHFGNEHSSKFLRPLRRWCFRWPISMAFGRKTSR